MEMGGVYNQCVFCFVFSTFLVGTFTKIELYITQVRLSMCRLKQVLTERALKEPNLRKRSDMKKLINAL